LPRPDSRPPPVHRAGVASASRRAMQPKKARRLPSRTGVTPVPLYAAAGTGEGFHLNSNRSAVTCAEVSRPKADSLVYRRAPRMAESGLLGGHEWVQGFGAVTEPSPLSLSHPMTSDGRGRGLPRPDGKPRPRLRRRRRFCISARHAIFRAIGAPRHGVQPLSAGRRNTH
jgi:hypothetical protein